MKNFDGFVPEATNRTHYYLAIFTYSFWGFLPFYFNLFEGVSATEVLVHRVLWSLLFTLFLLYVLGKHRELFEIFRSIKSIFVLLVSSVFLAINWLVFIYATETGQVLQLSIGYYINPLLNMLFGLFLFKEKVGKFSKFAISFACAGVLLQLISTADFPFLAIIIAIAFSCYGATRKLIKIDPLCGLFVETLVLSIPLLGWLIFASNMQSIAMMTSSIHWTLIFILAGPITSIPLITFAIAVKKIPYMFMGFFQYLTPSILFISAVFIFGERWSYLDIVTFSLIWLGVLFASYDVYHTHSPR